MVDGLVSFGQPVLIERRNLTEFSLQFPVTVLGQLPLKSHKYNLERRTGSIVVTADLNTPTVTSGGMQ